MDDTKVGYVLPAGVEIDAKVNPPKKDRHVEDAEGREARRQACWSILLAMRANGMDVCEDESVDMWSDDDVEYFMTNYEEYYI